MASLRSKILIFISFFLPFSATAALNDYKTATWNMQGSSAATESKWNVNVRGLITGNGSVNVVALQEAGTRPTSATPTGRAIPPVVTAGGRQIPIEEFEWNLGTRTRPVMRYIYYAQWDTGAGRVNPAIVSDRRADEIIALRNPVIPDGRPTLGIGFNRPSGASGRDYFFTLHASATGGGDARPFLDAIRNHFGANQDTISQWMVMGDYNQDPGVLQNRINSSPSLAGDVSIISQPNAPTQRSGGNLDYSVIGQYNGGMAAVIFAAMFIAQLHGIINSDHIPVKFMPK